VSSLKALNFWFPPRVRTVWIRLLPSCKSKRKIITKQTNKKTKITIADSILPWSGIDKSPVCLPGTSSFRSWSPFTVTWPLSKSKARVDFILKPHCSHANKIVITRGVASHFFPLSPAWDVKWKLTLSISVGPFTHPFFVYALQWNFCRNCKLAVTFAATSQNRCQVASCFEHVRNICNIAVTNHTEIALKLPLVYTRDVSDATWVRQKIASKIVHVNRPLEFNLGTGYTRHLSIC